nr:hypothetical protein [uncultured bacterium]
MKPIKKDELFQNLSGFLKSKGVELTEGTYSQRINRACDLLTDTINTTQKGVEKAKTKVDQKLDGLRQAIHEATAPNAEAGASTPTPPPPAAEPAKPKASVPRKKTTPAPKKTARKKK